MKSPIGKEFYQNRKDFIDKLVNHEKEVSQTMNNMTTNEISPLAKSIAKIKFQTGLGAAFSAIFNWKLLFNKQFAKFFLEVGKGGAMGFGQGVVTQTIHGTCGQAAGPIAGFLIMALFDTKKAVDTGDWSRFGKNMGANLVGTAASFGFGYLAGMGLTALAVTNPWVTIPVSILASGVGFFGGSWIAKKVTPLGGMTQKQFKEVYKVYNQHLKEQGCGIGVNFKQFCEQFQNGQITLKADHNYAQLSKGGQNLPNLLVDKMFKNTMKTIFTFAKYSSPSGDIPSGLKLLIAKMQ